MKKKDLDSLYNEDIANEEEDSYSFKIESKDVTKCLQFQRPPFVFAVIGKWGSGKSTFLNLIQSELSKNPNNIIIYFNSLRSSIHSNIMAAFVIEIKKQLGMKYGSKLEYVKQCLKDFIFSNQITDLYKKLKLPYSEYLTLLKHINKIISSLKKQLNRDYEIQVEAEKDILNHFDFICEILNKKKLNVYVIIDEIDRCSPSTAIKIIESLRILFTGRDNLEKNILKKYKHTDVSGIRIPFRYILAMDEDFISNSIRKAYGMNSIEAFEYLTKFIQHKYYLKHRRHAAYIRMLRDKYWEDKDWLNDISIDRIESILLIFKVKEPRNVRKILIYLYENQTSFPYKAQELLQLLEEKKGYKMDVNFTIIDALNLYWSIKACIKVVFPDEVSWVDYYNLLEKHFSTIRKENDYRDMCSLVDAQKIAAEMKKNWCIVYNNKNAQVPESELKNMDGKVRGRVEIMTYAFATAVEKLIEKVNNLEFFDEKSRRLEAKHIFDFLLYKPENLKGGVFPNPLGKN